MSNEKQLLTNSALTTFRQCPRKYQIRYELGYETAEESAPLYFGKLLHSTIERWYKSDRNFDKAIESIIDLINQEASNYQEGNESLYTLHKALALFWGYHKLYQFESLKPVAVEKNFTAPILNPETARSSNTYELAGVLDRIMQDPSGRYIIVETKTTSEDISPESDYWRRLSMDSQVSGYYLGAEVLDYKPETCLYDVIRKPTIKPKQVGKEIDPNDPKRVETPPEYYKRLKEDIEQRPEFYFARREVPRTNNDLEDYLFDTWHTAQSIRQYQLKNKFPRFTSSCVNFYGKCKFFDVCSGQAQLTDNTKFKKAEVNTELKKEEVAK